MSYHLPELTTAEENQLEKFLQQTRPRGLDRFVQLADGRRLDPAVIVPAGQGLGSSTSPGPSAIPPTEQSRPTAIGPPIKEPERKKPLTEAEARKAAAKLPPRLRKIPAVVEATLEPKAKKALAGIGSDNSNTQFAALALWAASRHGLPLERPLDALAKRFRRTQSEDGTWGYHPVKLHLGTPAMTGAGLIALAVGHGLHTDAKKVKDEQVEKGLRALATNIGKPLGADPKVRKLPAAGGGSAAGSASPRTSINMYFLWTLERVGVIYDIRKMDGKDWYGWGVELLLDAQQPDDGSWTEGGYPGSVKGASKTLDTCLGVALSQTPISPPT